MQSYFEKHLFKPIRIDAPVNVDVNLIVVIPCFNEPELPATLNSLHNCSFPEGKAEVIIVLNAAEDSTSAVFAQNEKTCSDIREWQRKTNPSFDVHLLRDEDLPRKHAGVGLARKIGMDEAAWRFHTAGKNEGVIVCLDADCTVASNYFSAIEDYFLAHPKTTAASIYFEHPLNAGDAKLREGIFNYELHLRYYRQALKYTGYPFHYHTIGSSMCVRSAVYRQAGGMNRRKAGEDFYFLHKIMPLGEFGEINGTAVYPSGRISERVPFGTGRAMKEWMNNESGFLTYDSKIFQDIKIFIDRIPDFFQKSPGETQGLVQALPASVSTYLCANDFNAKVQVIQSNVANQKMFVKRFLCWLDGFNMLKMVHNIRNNYYPDIQVEAAAISLLMLLTGSAPQRKELLLPVFRRLDSYAGQCKDPC